MKQKPLFLLLLLALLTPWAAKAQTGNISFADANVKAICVTNWDTSGDGELSYAEAAAVSSLGTVFIDAFQQVGTSITFNELQYFTGLTSINNDAFSGCWFLAAVTLPPSVQTIGSSAFKGCNNLSSIEIPHSVISIGTEAFRSCGALTSITIPSSVTSISGNPFFFCPALATITVEAGNTVYSSPEGSNAIIKTEEHKLVSGCKNTVIPEGVITIGASAFVGCGGLTEIHIPNSVTHIDSWAFNDCSGLTAVIIPSSVSYIGDVAFNGCINLTEMTVLATTPPSLDSDVFGEVNPDIPVYVPMGKLADYQNYNNSYYGYTSWGNFTSFFGTVTIGDEASMNTDYNFPVNMDYNYSLTQQIYTAEEIGTTGAITSIAFDYTNTLPFATEGMKMYMKNVDKTTFDSDTDMVDLSDATLVFDGTFAASGAGWVRLQLQTPFYYDGTSNLLLCCYDPTESYPGNEIEFRLTTTGNNYTALSYFSDEYNPDINNTSSFAGEKYRIKNRNNIYLTINPNIQFADPAVKAICVENWDTNNDGELSYDEAAMVTTLNHNGTNYNSVFRNKSITSFDELQYFTGLTAIEEDAFYNCGNLTSVTLPRWVTSIENSAFRNCSGLTSVTIGNSVTSIGEYAFFNCTGLTSVTIGNSVTSIGKSAFHDCTGLTSVTIGNSVTSIGNSAFNYCTGLTSVTIPDSVTSIGDNAFSYCTGLTSVTIGNSVTSIDSHAFGSCRGLTSVTIPDSVTSIGDNAFSYCTGLTSVTIGNSVASIGAYAFQHCSGLTSVTIPASVTSIDGNPFASCTLLESITVDPSNTVYSSPNGCNAIIKTADHRLVLGCKNTVIPNDVTVINRNAFLYCTGLTSIEIPASVSIIYADAFFGCSNLEEIRVGAVTPPTAYTLCFEYVPTDIPVYVPYQSVSAYKNAEVWMNFTNYIGIVTIGDEASEYTHYTLPVNMYYNYSLTQQIYTAEEIGTTGAITSIAFDYTNTSPFATEGMKVYMKNVDKTTFDSNSDMVDLSDATLVFDGTFAASRAGSVRLQLQTPFYYDGTSNLLLCCYDPTDGFPGYQIIFRQTTTDDNYTALTYHSDLYNPDINNISSFDGEKYRLTYRNNIYLAINPNIQFADDAVKAICVASSTGWDTNGDGELSYAEAAVVMTLGETFNGKTNITSFNELQYFDRLISIDDEAFSGCWSLASVTLPPALQTIGEFSFHGCNFPSIVIPNSVTSIGSHAFRSCGALTSITIPSSVTSIGENPFFSCPALASITVEAGNTVYSSPEGSNAIINTEEHKLVSGCKNTVIPEGMTTIGASAFGGCSGLTEIHIPSSVTLIDAWAFNSCSGLTEVTIPSSVTYIGNAAFYGCTGLTSITVEATTPPTLDNGAFDNVPVSIPVYVPCGTLEEYQSAAGWSDFTNLIDPCASQPQVVTLAAGTNWFSSNVEITLAQLEEAIVVGMANATGTTIKAKDGKTATYNGTNWRGTLTSLDVAQMYKITASSACEITLEGEPIIPAEHPLTIQANATTWIGFPLGQSMTVTDAFAGFNAVSGDQIKAKDGKSTSFNGTRWRGTLTNLEHGKGYVFSSSSAQDRTLVFPTSK